MQVEDSVRKQKISERWSNEDKGIVFATNKACQTCKFARGEADWRPEGLEVTPDLCYCQIYEPGDFGLKPRDVAFHGAPCSCYEEIDD